MHIVRTHYRERQLQRSGRILSVAAIAMGLLALVGAPAAWAAEPQQQAFRFVQICDTQLGFGAAGYEADVESFRQAVRQINQIKPDFAVICGDLVNAPTAEAFADFKKVLSEFKVPCYCAPGNHDVGGPPDRKKLAQYRQTIGKDYYSFEHRGYTFIVVNTQFWKSPVEPDASKHDSWFVQTLERAADNSSPAFVIGHHPLFLSDAGEKEAYFNIPPQRRKELLDLYLQHGVVAMLTGHTHRLCDNEHEGILLLSGETTSKNFDKRPLGFRLWEVDSPDSIRHSLVALEARDKAVEQDRAKAKILLLATPPDHPYGTHMYLRGCEILAKCLRQHAGVEAVACEGWPGDPEVLKGVRAIALYSGPGDFVLREPHRQQFEELMRGGVGFSALHWGTGAAPDNAEQYKSYLGGYFTPKFGLATTATTVEQILPDDPISCGWSNFDLRDEIYLNPELLPATRAVAKVCVQGPADSAPKDQTIAWCYERPGGKGGRSFGCSLGHFHELFGKEPFRRLLVNGILWTAGIAVPEEGAPCCIEASDLELPPDPRIVAEVRAHDADGDGDLSESELNALVKDRIKAHSSSPVYVKIFDKDKDGKVSDDEERQAYLAVKNDFLRQCRVGKVPISAAGNKK